MSAFSGVLLLSLVNARLDISLGQTGLINGGLITGGGFGPGLSDRRPGPPPFIDIDLGEPDLPTYVPDLPIVPDELPSRT